MKIDGGIGFDPDGIAAQAAKAEAERLRRRVVGRDQPRPVPPDRHRRRPPPRSWSSAPASPWPSPATR